MTKNFLIYSLLVSVLAQEVSAAESNAQYIMRCLQDISTQSKDYCTTHARELLVGAGLATAAYVAYNQFLKNDEPDYELLEISTLEELQDLLEQEGYIILPTDPYAYSNCTITIHITADLQQYPFGYDDENFDDNLAGSKLLGCNDIKISGNDEFEIESNGIIIYNGDNFDEESTSIDYDDDIDEDVFLRAPLKTRTLPTETTIEVDLPSESNPGVMEHYTIVFEPADTTPSVQTADASTQTDE